LKNVLRKKKEVKKMLNVINAWTEEIDEIDDAVEELLGQINVPSLKKNSVGLIGCYYEFITGGLIAALKEKLPFDIAGFTTMGVSAMNKYSQYALCLTVFTSDDISFSTSITAVAEDSGDRARLKAVWDEAAAGGKPGLVIPLFPHTLKVSASSYLKDLDEISGGVQMFGTACCDFTMTHENAAVFKNTTSEKSGIALLCMRGPFKPEFNIVSMPTRNVQLQKATVTKSAGCVLHQANGMSFKDYVTTLGIEKLEDPTILATLPLSLDYGDGKPVTVALFKINEDGSAFCGAEIPQGITFSIGSMDHASIMETANEMMDWARGERPVLLFSCVGRFLLLSPDNEDEMKLFAKKWEEGKKTPHALAYSGGEVCPVPGKDGALHNRYHNYTCVGCKF
jgi:hypothetical protein